MKCIKEINAGLLDGINYLSNNENKNYIKHLTNLQKNILNAHEEHSDLCTTKIFKHRFKAYSFEEITTKGQIL